MKRMRFKVNFATSFNRFEFRVLILLGLLAVINKPGLLNYLPVFGGKIRGFTYFLKSISPLSDGKQSNIGFELESAWAIFYDSNHLKYERSICSAFNYTHTHTQHIYNIYIYIYIYIVFKKAGTFLFGHGLHRETTVTVKSEVTCESSLRWKRVEGGEEQGKVYIYIYM